jgi:DNA-binding NtrC family response regulator
MKAKGKVFLMDDDELIVRMLSRALKTEGYDVRFDTTAHDAANKIRSWSPDVAMLDIHLPEQSGMDILQELKSKGTDTQIVMLTGDDSAETAVEAMKLGAVDYLTKPLNLDKVKLVLKNIMEKGKLRQEVNYLRKVSGELFDKDFIGDSETIMELKGKIAKLVEADISTILITGESGTGKELMARYVHRLLYGHCASGCAPFIGVNCAALPEHLLESELFGYEKGAFTDAKADKKGLFELAEEGTLLLDEIGDMKIDLQSKLLRVLEERTFRRIGGKEEIPVDVTLVATTNRNLSEAVEKGSFRLDLYYRLNTFSLLIPPMRERKDDIMRLARHFLSYFSEKYNRHTIKDFSAEAEKLLFSYRWPGNVRELKNVIERIVVLENTEKITPEHLPREISRGQEPAAAPASERFVLPEEGISLDEVERDLIMQAMKRAGHNKTLAAKLLGISYDSLRYHTKKYGFE